MFPARLLWPCLSRLTDDLFRLRVPSQPGVETCEKIKTFNTSTCTGSSVQPTEFNLIITITSRPTETKSSTHFSCRVWFGGNSGRFNLLSTNGEREGILRALFPATREWPRFSHGLWHVFTVHPPVNVLKSGCVVWLVRDGCDRRWHQTRAPESVNQNKLTCIPTTGYL